MLNGLRQGSYVVQPDAAAAWGSGKATTECFELILGNKPLVRSESGCFPHDMTGLDHVVLGMEVGDRAGMEALLDVFVKAFPRIAGRVRLLLEITHATLKKD